MTGSRTFYHFTSLAHLPLILHDQRLVPTDPNLHMLSSAGPQVVWLTDEQEPALGKAFVDDGLRQRDSTDGLSEAKRQVRFEVDVRAIRWLDWTPNVAGADPDWRETLIKIGGGIERAEHWYVWPAPIRRRRWVSLHDLVNDRVLSMDLAEDPVGAEG